MIFLIERRVNERSPWNVEIQLDTSNEKRLSTHLDITKIFLLPF